MQCCWYSMLLKKNDLEMHHLVVQKDNLEQELKGLRKVI